MTQEQLTQKIDELQKAAQDRLTAIAQSDPVWCNVQGQLGAYNEMLGSTKADVVEVSELPGGKVKEGK